MLVAVDPASQLELGNTSHELGDYDRAIKAYRGALALLPDFVEAHANLAVVYHILGRNEEARRHAERAVALDPVRPEPRVTLAVVQGALGGYEIALQHVDRVLTIDPHDVSAWFAAIYAFAKLERYPEALEAARRVLAIAPESSLAQGAYAGCLRSLGRYDEAFDALDHAEQSAGQDEGALLAARAGLLMDGGRTAEAMELLKRALSVQPDNTGAWLALADAHPFHPGDPLIGEMEEVLATSPRLRIPANRLTLHFALGKAHYNAGNPAAAFHHFAHGNRLKREAVIYSIEADERWLRSITTTYSRSTMRRLRGSGDAAARPIYVLGMPRSGTTLVEQILASHPAVYGGGELQVIPELLSASEFPSGPSRGQVAALGRRAAEALGQIGPAGRRVVDKLTGNFARAGLIHAMLPGARIVHCRRDAFDTALSCYMTLFVGRLDYTYDLSELGRYYLAYDELMRHWHDVIPAHVMLELSYETLVDDFEGLVRELLAFCDLPWDDACLRFHETERAVRTASRTQVRRPLYSSSVGNGKRYQAYLDPLPTVLAGYAG
jgi:tetratricopeptide (TPR) repeat protein